jgi:hypothetical protein
MLTLTEE